MNIAHEGSRVLVTGGGSGIGRVIARTYRDAGARVHVTDIDPDAVASARAEGLGASICDAAAEEEIRELVGKVDRSLGGLDILVNNAGVAGPTANIEDIATADFEMTLRVGLQGSWMHAKHFLPRLRRSAQSGNEPSILSLTSVAGIVGAPQRTPYSAAKWGIVGLTKSLARELGPEGIRVNAIAPGIIEGPRIDGVITRKAQAIQRPLQEVRAEYVGQADLNRMPTAQDIANMCAFVTSGLGRNVHGQVISVDGHIDRLI